MKITLSQNHYKFMREDARKIIKFLNIMTQVQKYGIAMRMISHKKQINQTNQKLKKERNMGWYLIQVLRK